MVMQIYCLWYTGLSANLMSNVGRVMSIYNILTSGGEYEDVEKSKPSKSGVKDHSKVLRLNPKGRVTIPSKVLSAVNSEAEFYSTLYNKKTNRLAIIFFKERPAKPSVRVISFYKGSRKANSVATTAYIELKPQLTSIFQEVYKKSFSSLEKSVDIPYEKKEGYLDLVLDLFK